MVTKRWVCNDTDVSGIFAAQESAHLFFSYHQLDMTGYIYIIQI
jgi:hypothetical protein